MHQDLPVLKVIGAPEIEHWLGAHAQKTFELVRDTYLAHSRGETINPDSYFLRFPDSVGNRIIALPSSIETGVRTSGIKWISSFPSNPERGLDRASALLIVNDRSTGYPLACMEGSVISAARTAASAAVGAHFLHPTPGRIHRVGVIGCGLIAQRSVELLHRLGWQIGGANLTDLSFSRAALFRAKCNFLPHIQITDLRTTITESDLLIFATSAPVPYVNALEWFRHAPTILHISLRDISANVILCGQNVADDIDHCLKAETSLHLAFQTFGRKSFIDGDIAAVINGEIHPDRSRHRIFSPFGMGILDLALAREILLAADSLGVTSVPGFFPVPYAAAVRKGIRC